ncbi:hypothetical protein FO519_003644 [Halicephalobus sp. NKZ332]|nr:hypothetical protein FO519_003644 [Halicephalobus sp. NKZ332]
MTDSNSQLLNRIRDYNSRIQKLSELFNSLKSGEPAEELLDLIPEYVEVQKENSKLKYRKNILQESIKERMKNPGSAGPSNSESTAKKEKKETKEQKVEPPKIEYVKVEDFGNSTVARLKDIFTKAQEAAYPQVTDFPCMLSEAGKNSFGDYQCNTALTLTKKLKAVGINDAPPVIAKKIIDATEKGDIIEELQTSGPGFINVSLKPEFVASRIGGLLKDGIRPPKLAKKKALVDFSSPNIAKEMHVGHLRSTIIGDSICRLLEFVGFEVMRINHVGDWGTQFGMLIAHLQDRFPNYLNETPPIGDLQAFYKESKKRFDEDEKFKVRAYECVVKLQNFDSDIVKAWKMICAVSRADFDKIYERLDIRIEERGESFYQQRMVDLVKEMEERGALTVEDGRKVIFPPGLTVPLTIVKSDGGFTYDTSDLAALKQRIYEEKVDWVLYVIDAGQSLHLETVYAAGRYLGYYKPEEKRVQHVGFGLVLGEDKKKFKTRSGDTVRLTDLLDEGISRAEAKMVEKAKERNIVLTEEESDAAKKAIAYGCVKYADLSHTRINDYVFSFDRMLDDRGNTALYLLYAYVRIRAIGRNAKVSRETLLEHIKKNNGLVKVEHPAEVKLAKQVLRFSDVLLTVLDTLLIHTICDYVYNLSTTFTDFYSACRVVSQKEGTVDLDRLALCEATADTMATCFQILGIRTLERI